MTGSLGGERHPVSAEDRSLPREESMVPVPCAGYTRTRKGAERSLEAERDSRLGKSLKDEYVWVI